MTVNHLGRPRELIDRKSASIELDKPHRDYISQVQDEFKQSTGVQLTRSAAVRLIIEQHQHLATKERANKAA